MKEIHHRGLSGGPDCLPAVCLAACGLRVHVAGLAEVLGDSQRTARQAQGRLDKEM